MDLGLKDRTALVTAASRGFGLATARTLAAEGARVALCARGGEDLAKAAAEVEAVAGPGRVWSRTVDVTDDAAVRALVAGAEEALGPVDLLLVNAGGPPAGISTDVARRVEEAVEHAKASPRPEIDAAYTNVFADGGAQWRN